jgi:zinc-binding alcohol dehydrogenase/oxidoreductase
MRALQISAINQLAVTVVDDPLASPGEVVIAIQAAALNHRDVWIKRGDYAGLKFPCIPGSDGAGNVVAVGGGVDPAWIGREVIVNPAFDWGAHERAQDAKFSILGLPRAGMLAEKIAVPVGQLSLKPAHLSWEEAAALPLAGVTAFRAMMTRAELTGNERVLISGIGGGVAVFALQFAVAHGAAVWVTSSSEEKIARAVALGAKGGINYTKLGWATDAVKAVGRFDVIVDSAGGDGFEQLVDLAAPGARLVFYGATRGNPPGLPMRKIFWRQLSLLGTTMGSPADWEAMTKFVALHRLKPVVSDVVPFDRAVEAFDLMEQGARFGKIVVRM